MPKRWIDRLLFAETCLLCGRGLNRNPYVCDRCLLSLKPHPERDIYPIPYLDGYKTFTRYGRREKRFLRLVKFNGAKSLARDIGHIASPHLRGYIAEIKPQLVTFIPTNPWRYWFLRGFDPVEEMLKGASVDYEKILKRRWLIRKPLSQAKNVAERRKLVKNTFRIERGYIPRLRGVRVLVVDDVLTSGSTASEVARLLKGAGAEEVYLFAFFRPRLD